MTTTLFQTGLKVIIFLSAIFFLFFWYVCLMWTNRKISELKNILAAAAVSLIHTFKIFVLSVFLIALFHIILAVI